MPTGKTEETIKKRAAAVESRIKEACTKAKRDPESITLVAAVKTFGEDTLRAAYAAGIRHFGESYAQDLRDKAASISDLSDIQWHFIGKIQSNKIRYLADITQLVHSIDRLETAKLLSERVLKVNRPPIGVMLSVNLGLEETKSGVEEKDLGSLCENILQLPGLKLKGLMCLPPWSKTPENSRPYFRRLRELVTELQIKIGDDSPLDLSMGMSDDLEIAIEEGATIIRVGSALLGPRERRS